MASVIRILCTGAFIVAATGCHAEDDSLVLRYITSGDYDDGGGDGGDGGDERPSRPSEKGDPSDTVCGYHTQTQGGWGSKCKGNNPGCFRDQHFAKVFNPHLAIGCGSNRAVFTNSYAVRNALPAGGPARAMMPGEARSYHGADKEPLNNILGGQALAMTLNVGFSALEQFVPQSLPPFASLEIVDEESPCYGMTVGEALAAVNDALGGCSWGLTPAEANLCATRINESFVDGKPECSKRYRYTPGRRLPAAMLASGSGDDSP